MTPSETTQLTITLGTLGSTDLRDDAGAEITSVLRQPKRFALLVYLVLRAPGQFLRRDQLLALFWPDLDQEHARAALRRALHFLRRALGEAVIESRGDEELRVTPGRVTCDALELQRALQRGASLTDLGYSGDFLEGLYVAGSPEFEPWAAGIRLSLRDRASRAAWDIAEQASRPPAERCAAAQRAVGLAIDDDLFLAKAMVLLESLGEAPAGLRLYRDHCRRRAELALEPEAAATTVAARFRPDPTPATTTDAPRIAVLPFSLHGDPAFSYLGEGMVDLLVTALDGAGNIRTVVPAALLGGAGAAAPSPADAARLGATLIIQGSLIASPGQLRLLAALIDPAGRVLGRAEVEGPDDERLLDLVDQLSRQLLTIMAPGPAGRLARLATRTTESLPALRAWLQGEHQLRSGRVGDANAAFADAAQQDPRFAMAFYRNAAAAAAGAMIGPARQASASAMLHRHQLSDRDRLLVEAQDAWLRGQLHEAEQAYGLAVSEWPDDVDAWFLLGDLLFHGNPYRGRSSREAREPLQRALTLDPARVSGLGKLARIAALEARWADLDSLVESLLARSPDHEQALPMRALRAWALGHEAEQERITQELSRARALTIGIAFSDVVVYTADLTMAERLGCSLAGVARSDELRALVQLMLAQLAAARGDLTNTLRQLDEAERLSPAWSLELRGLLVSLPFLPWPDQVVSQTIARLEAWRADQEAPDMGLPLAFHNGLHPHLRAYLLGLLAEREGNDPDLVRHAEDLAELTGPAQGEGLVERLERSLNARLWLRRGEPELALAELAGAGSAVWFQYAVGSPFFSGVAERWLRGSLLHRLGRHQEAAGWLGALAERSPWEVVFRGRVDFSG